MNKSTLNVEQISIELSKLIDEKTIKDMHRFVANTEYGNMGRFRS